MKKYVEVGEFLHKMRKNKNISISHFSKYLGVSESTIHEWEAGISIPNEAILEKIASFYECSKDEIKNGKFNDEERNIELNKKKEKKPKEEKKLKPKYNRVIKENKEIFNDNEKKNRGANYYKIERNTLITFISISLLTFVIFTLFSYIFSYLTFTILGIIFSLLYLVSYYSIDRRINKNNRYKNDITMKLLKHKYLHHLIFITIGIVLLNIILMVTSIYFESIFEFKWYILVIIFTSLVLFSTDYNTYQLFYEKNELELPKWYIKLKPYMKICLSFYSAYYLFVAIDIIAILVINMYLIRSDEVTYYHFLSFFFKNQNPYFYIGLGLFILSLVWGILNTKAKRGMFIPFLALHISTSLFLVSIIRVYKDVLVFDVIEYTYGYNFYIGLFISLTVFAIFNAFTTIFGDDKKR